MRPASPNSHHGVSLLGPLCGVDARDCSGWTVRPCSGQAGCGAGTGGGEQTEGTSSTSDEKVFVFTYKDGDKQGRLTVPYARINELEYGQKAGRRIGLAV